MNKEKKYEYISRLSKDTVKKIVSDENEWMRYLASSARMCKYSFMEQLLIYAQKPEATACASMEIWNRRMNCWINRGAKGISLIDLDDPDKNIRYVFDISDVHEGTDGHKPELWVMGEEHKTPVINALEDEYGAVIAGNDHETPFEERIINLSVHITEMNIDDTVVNFINNDRINDDDDGITRDYDTARGTISSLLSSSVAYSILSRCGCNTDEWKTRLNFSSISEFKSDGDLYTLGCAITELAKPVLIQIEKTIEASKQLSLFDEHIKAAENNINESAAFLNAKPDVKTDNFHTTDDAPGIGSDIRNVEAIRTLKLIESYSADIRTFERYKNDGFAMTVGDRVYTDKAEAGQAIIDACMTLTSSCTEKDIGEYMSFKITVSLELFDSKFSLKLKGEACHEVSIGTDPSGNIQRINNVLSSMERDIGEMLRKLDNTKTQLETAKKEAARPFAKEQELTEKSQKLAQLNALLSMDEKEPTEHKAIEVSETVKDSTGGERRSVIEKLSRYKSETSSKSINQELSHTNQSTGCRDLIPKH
jgi:hypothetical protein